MHGNSMNVSIKNNLNLLSKRNRLKCVPSGFKKDKRTEYDLPKASSKQLRNIKKRMQTERQLWWIYTLLLTVLVFIIGVWVLFFSGLLL